MQYTEVRPSIDELGNVSYPRKRDFMVGLRTVIQKSLQHAYFAVYYTGMTKISTGNWVVLADDSPEDYDTISMSEIFQVAQEVGFKGQIWFSLDAPYAGQWILEISKTEQNYPFITNFLLDAACDWGAETEYLTYIARLTDKTSGFWTRNRPVAYNKTFNNVVWPDGKTTQIPNPRKIFEWLAWDKNAELTTPKYED